MKSAMFIVPILSSKKLSKILLHDICARMPHSFIFLNQIKSGSECPSVWSICGSTEA